MLMVIDEYTRECLAIDVARRLKSDDVLERLSGLFVARGVPEHIRSDHGPVVTAEVVRGWPGRVGVKTLFIEWRAGVGTIKRRPADLWTIRPLPHSYE
jgi:hypothetical protein